LYAVRAITALRGHVDLVDEGEGAGSTASV